MRRGNDATQESANSTQDALKRRQAQARNRGRKACKCLLSLALSVVLVTGLVPSDAYSAIASSSTAEQDSASSTVAAGSTLSESKQSSAASQASTASSSHPKTNAGSSKAESAKTASASSTGQAGSASRTSYLGVEDNDNEKANVRDTRNGGADSLKVSVKAGSAANAKARRAPAKSASNGVTAADGSSIDSMGLIWKTNDTTDDGDAANLYLKPNDNTPLSITAQVDFSLSGEHDYEPGAIQVKIPAYLFQDREGNNHGNLVLPLDEAPSTKTAFNWSFIDDENGGYYILTNTHQMSSASSVAIEFAYENLTPSEVVDMKKTSDLTAELSVTTVSGNELSQSAGPLTATIDTHETVASADKDYYDRTTKTAEQLRAQGCTIPDEYAGETKFLVLTWATDAYHEGNTNYTMTWNDTPSLTMQVGGNTVACKSFVLSNGTGTSEKKLWCKDNSTATEYVRVAYPYSQFEPETTYKISNSVEWTCTETDDGSKTSATSSDTYDFSYHLPQGTTPTGHFYHEKWGIDDDAHSNYSHNGSGYYPRYLSGAGNWGIYPNALNKLAKNQDATVCYDQYLRGWFLPWLLKSGEDGKQVTDYGDKDVTMTLEDGDINYRSAVDSEDTVTLDAGTDFDFTTLRLTKPTVWKAVEYDASDLDAGDVVYLDDGSQVYSAGEPAKGGTYGVGYVEEQDATHFPEFTVEAMTDGTWQTVATVSWADGDETKNIDLPAGTTRYRVSVTAGKDEDGDGVYVAAIADAFVTPYITLHPTDKVKNISQTAFDTQSEPTTYLTNRDSFVASQNGNEIMSMSGDDYPYHRNTAIDQLKGYSDRVQAIPSKESTYRIDTAKQTAEITYTAKVREISNLTSIDDWKEATAGGDLSTDVSGTWYDLLPKGIVPDLSTIQLRSGDSVADAYTVPNYKNSGRMLLVVKTNLTPSPFIDTENHSEYVEDDPEITFTASCPLESVKDYGSSRHNVIAYESGNETLGTVANHAGEPDKPVGNNTVTKSSSTFADQAEKDTMTDLDPNADNPNFVYAGTTTNISHLSYSVAELNKKAMVNDDGYWGTGVTGGSDATDTNELTVYTGGRYQYRLSATANAKTRMSGAVLYDIIDGYTPTDDKADHGDTQWKGTLVSVDTSALEQQGIAPVVYYTTKQDIAIASANDDSVRSADAADLSDTDVWSTTPPDDLSQVTAIAIDCSKNQDGSDFVIDPGDTISAYVTMHAPANAEAQQYIAADKGGTSADADGAHAYNNVYLYSSNANAQTGETLATKLIRHDYTKVGLKNYDLKVSKAWDDANDQDGIRPSSTTVHLYRNGTDTGLAVTLDGTADAAQGNTYESAAWEGLFKGLDYCDPKGQPYHYSFVEDPIEGYTAGIVYGSGGSVTLTNKHIPDTVKVSGTKTWEDSSPDLRPESITVQLYRDGKRYDSQTIRADKGGNWSYAFNNLPRYHDHGQAYSYTVSETVEDYATKYDTATNENGNITANLTNTYHPFGNLAISKSVTNVDDACADQEFAMTIRLGNPDGSSYNDPVDYEITDNAGTQVSTGTFTNGKTLKIKAGETLTLKELPKGTTYQVIEENAKGYTPKTDRFSGTIKSNETAQAAFENEYKTEGIASFRLTKNLAGANLKRNQFRFTLYDVTNGEPGTLLRVTSNTKDGMVAFGGIHYTSTDHNKTYTYKIAENDGGDAGVAYDKTIYYAQVTPIDNGHGKMTCDIHYYSDAACTQEVQASDAAFTNSYAASGQVELTAFKTLAGGTLTDGQFSFQLYDQDGNKLYLDDNGKVTTMETATPLNAANTVDGTIAFPTINYTQDDLADRSKDGTVTGYSTKNFYYTAREDIPGDAIAYNDDNSPMYVTADGTAIDNDTAADGSANTPLTYANATDKQKAKYRFVKDGVKYANTDQTWQVTVADNGDGTLGITTTVVKKNDAGEWEAYDKAPLFENSMMPGKLEIQKTLTDDSTGYDPDQLFYYIVKITTSDGQPLPDGAYPYTIESIEDTAAQSSETASESSDDSSNGNSLSNRSSSKTTKSNARKAQSAPTEESAAPEANAKTTKHLKDGSVVYAAKDTTDTKTEKEDKQTAKRNSAKPILRAATPADQGTAYAVLDSDGTLTLIRSNETVKNGSEGSITDCEGNTYTGTIYTGFEDRTSFDSYGQPWNVSKIKKVVVKDKIKPKCTAYWFYKARNCTSMDLANLDTSEVTDMRCMFSRCQSLTELDVSNFDTSNVTNMNSMFSSSNYSGEGVMKLEKITGLENWDTSKVTDMGAMFYRCWWVRSLDTSNFNTSNVTNMASMFGECGNLHHVDVSGFDTSKVTNMRAMFDNDLNVEELDVANWNTSNVTDMSSMFSLGDFGGWPFRYNSSLKTLDVSKWDTSKVTDMNWMFGYMKGVTELDVSHFDTSNVTNMESMFFQMVNLNALDVSHFDTSKVTDMLQMFDGDEKLKTLDVSGWNTSNVTNMQSTFVGCSGLTEIKGIGNLDTSSVTEMSWMFSSDKSLTTLDVSNWDTSKVTDMKQVFGNCSNLLEIKGIENLNTSNVTNMRALFSGDESLISLDLSKWNTAKVRNMGRMFYNCTSLETLNLEGFNTHSINSYGDWVKGMEDMFEGDRALHEVTIGKDWSFKGNNLEKEGYWALLPGAMDYENSWHLVGTNIYKTNTELRDGYDDNVEQWAGTWVRERAHWVVKYNANGGVGSMADQVSDGGNITLAKNTFYRKGYYFAGWRTATDEELEKNPYAGKRYSDGQEITNLNQDVTLYAQWRKLEAQSHGGTFYIALKAGQKAVFENLPIGAQYSVVESSAPGWTLSSSSGTSGTVTQSTSTASFVNKFTPGSTNVTIAASKLLTGLSPDDGAFTFNLYEGDQATGNPIQTATNVGSSVTFNPITFTYDANEWQGQDYQYRTYTIAEVLPEDDDPNTEGVQKDGITYDQHIEHAYVEIRHSVQDGKDMLGASAYYDWNDSTPYQALFTNVPEPGNLTISKEAVGQSDATADQDFSFDVTLLKNGKPLTEAYDWTSTDGRSGTIENGGTITLKGGGSATISGLPVGTTYFVTEAGSADNWSRTASSSTTGVVGAGSSTTASFTNTYKANGSTTLSGTKTVKNLHANYKKYAKGAFTFALYEGTDTSGTPLDTAGNSKPNADGTSNFTFAPIDYTMQDLKNDDGTYAKEKDLTYTIAELPNGDDRYATDSQTWTAIVHLTDEGNGKIATSVRYENASGTGENAAFTNQYLPAGSTVVQAGKKLTGRHLKNGEFTVSVRYASNNAEAFKMANKGSTFTSPRLSFNRDELNHLAKEGKAIKTTENGITTWSIPYAMSEILPRDDNPDTEGVQKKGVTYDGGTHTATAVFTDTGGDKLHAAVTYDKGSSTPPTFKNTFRTHTSLTLKAKKKLSGGKLKDGQFTFDVKGPHGSNETATNRANGTIVLPTWIYTKPGTYRYTLTEVDDNQPGVSYDDAAYRITVKVTRNAAGKLHAKATVAGKKATPKSLTFKNSCNQPPTGADNANSKDNPDNQNGTDSTNESSDQPTLLLVPITGDNALPIGILIAVAVAALVLLIAVRRHRNGGE
ncbi:MAG: BspA family leucine-rich repeat surface protein [Eggerthellaceae bacterium]|jgi:pilin isopeptide linkage protein